MYYSPSMNYGGAYGVSFSNFFIKFDPLDTAPKKNLVKVLKKQMS